MGISSCQIHIDETKDGFHKAGEILAGSVKYVIDKPTEYKAVVLSFLGTGKCFWSERYNKTSTSYSGEETYVATNIDLLSKTWETATIGSGTYVCSFTFQIPINAPSTFKNDMCNIRYRIKLKFIQPQFFSSIKKFSTDLQVRGLFTPTIEGPAEYALEKVFSKPFAAEKPVLQVRAAIVDSLLTPDKNAVISLVVTNNTNLKPSIKTQLYSYTTLKADNGHARVTSDKIHNSKSDKIEITEQGEVSFSQTIPISNPLAIATRVVTTEFKLRVTVKVPLPHRNVCLEIPVAIGEKENDFELLDEARRLNASEPSKSTKEEATLKLVEPGKEVEPPPSYWDVMLEDRDKE